MKKITLLLTIALLLALLAGCKKNEPTPPYHKDIFRCKVNGVEWVATCPSEGLFGCEPVRCRYYSDTPSFELVGLRINFDKTINQSIHIYTLSHYLKNSQLPPGLPGIFKDFNKPSGCRFWDWNESNIGFINITNVDSINRIITGEFEFECVNLCNDTINVTDGFFHVNFRF